MNGSTYIGSGTDLTRRFRDYLAPEWLIKEVKNNNSIIYRALLKYGYNSFRLEILEYCEESKVLEREQYFLDKLKPTYNICNIAGSSAGRVVRGETRLKLRKAWLVRLHKNSLSKLSLRDFTLQYLAEKVDKLESNISILTKKFDSLITKTPEFKQSAETRLKKLVSSPILHPVLVTDLKTGKSTKYPSSRRAADALGISPANIRNRLSGKITKAYKERYIFKLS